MKEFKNNNVLTQLFRSNKFEIEIERVKKKGEDTLVEQKKGCKCVIIKFELEFSCYLSIEK